MSPRPADRPLVTVVAKMVAVVLAVLLGLASGVTKGRTQGVDETDLEEETREITWKKCALQLTPSCLKLTLARLVDRLENSHFQPLPGVELTSNRSRALQEADSGTRGSGQDDQLLEKVAGFLRSLTLKVRLLELPGFNTTRLVDSLVSKVTGRKNKGNAGLLAVALMMGGTMMTMMMAALAAMSGKALMTGMAALMLAALGAMKGHGGGGGKSTTYEVIAQPEVHHGHGWKRSLDAQDLVYLSKHMTS